jgi:cell shape-determining protein MreC
MDYDELFKKYQSLLVEFNGLKAENKRLKGQLGIIEQPVAISDKISEIMLASVINQKSEADGKIELYLSLSR